MTLIQRVDRQDAGGAVADLFAADYVGALVGGSPSRSCCCR